MPTIGAFRRRPAADPEKRVPPKLKTPPSAAAKRYPPAARGDAMPTTGWLSGFPVREPDATARPPVTTSPAADASQSPSPDGVAAAPTNAVRDGTVPPP